MVKPSHGEAAKSPQNAKSRPINVKRIEVMLIPPYEKRLKKLAYEEVKPSFSGLGRLDYFPTKLVCVKMGPTALTVKQGYVYFEGWGLRSPHEATCQSIASRFPRGRNYVVIQFDFPGKTFTINWHIERANAHRRTA